MDAATSTFNHSFNMGPNPIHGGPQMQGASNMNQGPSTAPFPEEQHHQKPFFYVQPSQPYLPMQSMQQWPMPLAMPLSYNPYYGYPGFGYGMPLMPHYQPNPYMETPGFVVPHTHLHLIDYRRMLNPQYYQSMAYHARRLRYQHNVVSRGVTSSEVQTEPLPTEPLPTSQRTSTPGSSNETSNATSSLSTALSAQKDEQSLEMKDLVPLSTNTTASESSFVIKTEEVRIECRTTPAGLQVMHSRETAEMSHSFSQDVVKCSSVIQNGLLLDDDDNLQLLNAEDKTEQSQQACPDILLVGTPNSNDKIPALETNPVSSMDIVRSNTASDIQGLISEKDLKVVHLPFDAKYLDELRKRESTVWSMEETLVPSPEFLIESQDETLLGEVPSAETLILNEEMVQEDDVSIIDRPLRIEDELQDVVPTVELPVDELSTEDIPQEPCQPVMKSKTDHFPNFLQSDYSPLDGNIQDHQDTSFESLPAYLSSTSWLADFENVRYCKMPPTPQKQNKPLMNRSLDVPTRRRKLDVEFKESSVCMPKEQYNTKGTVDRRSLSDHECCMSRSYNENTFIPYGLKGQQLCTRCSTKQRVYNTSPGIDNQQVLKRKLKPFQPCNDVILPTCNACKGHAKKRLTRKGSSPDVRLEIEGESSENGSSRKWKPTDDPRKEMKRPLASKQNVELCQTVREKNCLCNELQHHQTQWQRSCHCPHGNVIRETDENYSAPTAIKDKWRNVDQMFHTHRWQTEKSWNAVMPSQNIEGFKNYLRAQHLNKHKKTQSQGVHRKDTRC